MITLPEIAPKAPTQESKLKAHWETLTVLILSVLDCIPRARDIADMDVYRPDPEYYVVWRPIDAIALLGGEYGADDDDAYDENDMRDDAEEWHYRREGARLMRTYADAIAQLDMDTATHLRNIADGVERLDRLAKHQQ